LNKIIFYIILGFFSYKNINAQLVAGSSREARFFYSEAQKFMKAKQYDSAIDYFRECVSLEKSNTIFHRDYAMAFLANKEYGKAAIIIEKAMELEDADETIFQLAGIIFNSKSDYTLGLKSLNKGLEIFPNSATLYNAKAELLYDYKDDKKAIALWQKAMSIDSTMYSPYYFLAKLNDTNYGVIASTILYAETFILHEPFSTKSAEMKKLMYQCYKILYKQMFDKNSAPSASIKKNAQVESAIENKYIRILKLNKYLWMDNFSIDNFTSIRERVVEDWRATQMEANMPSLIKFHQSLIEQNLFETYNQWLLGSLFSKTNFTKWASANASSLNRLSTHFQNNTFK
jgi:tetratricopeptide (TPR) repeat protein